MIHTEDLLKNDQAGNGILFSARFVSAEGMSIVRGQL